MEQISTYSFAPFPNENWQSETPAEVKPAVDILRKKLDNYCKGVFRVAGRHLREIRYEPGPGRKGALLDRAFKSLEEGIGQALRPFTEEFVAQAHPVTIADPVNWAYAQMHSALSECTGDPRLKWWLINNCEPAPERRATDNFEAMVQKRRDRDSSWRAEGWMKQHCLGTCAAHELWEQVDEKTTEAILKGIRQVVWLHLEDRLRSTVEGIMLSLAAMHTHASSSKEAESSATKQEHCSCSEFDRFVAPRWSVAQSKNGRRVKDLRDIAAEIDSAGFGDPSVYLEGNRAVKALRNFNSKNSNTKSGAVKRCADLVALGSSHPQSLGQVLRAFRKRLSRAQSNVRKCPEHRLRTEKWS